MKRSRIQFWSICVLSCLVGWSLPCLAGEGAETWLRTYRGESYGAFFDITSAGEGLALVTGASFHSQTATRKGDVLIAQISTDTGDIVWQATYGGEAYDQGLYIEKTEEGGYLILGETESMGAGGRDLYLLRIDEAGVLLWEKTYGGAGTEWAKDMLRLSDGGYLLIAETNSFGETFDAYVLRLSADGTELWSAILDDGASESATAALEAPNGDLLVLAVVSYPGGSAGQYRDSRLYRLDSDGSRLWSVLYHGDRKQAGDAMSWTTDGDLVIAGLSELATSSAGLLDFWLARVDADQGELQWSQVQGRQFADDYGISISSGTDGQFLVAGLGPGFPLLKFDESGTLSWIRNAALDLGIYAGFAVLESGDGAYLIPGFKYMSQSADAFDAVLLRYREAGSS